MPIQQTLLSSTEFQISLLLFVALAGYLIAYRINQSAVVGIILAGIVVGPSLLNLVTYTEFVSGLAHLGAVVLLFTIGLEFEFKEIVKIKYFFIALIGVAVPWAGGYFLARLFQFDYQTAVFIGTVLTATSIAITANVLSEMGKLQTSAAKAIIGAAVIDDVLALLALSLSQQITSGSLSLAVIPLMILKALGFILVGFLLGKFLGKILIRFDRTRLANKYPESIFIFAIMTSFLYAMGADLVGLSAIVGSFLAGVSFSGLTLTHGKIFKDGSEHLRIIFASIFFVSLGVLLDVHAITLNIIYFMLALTAVAAITKIIGCGVPAKLGGMSFRDSLIVGFGMMPRGEVAMTVALIGLNQNLIRQDVYGALILMSILTTVIAPIIFRNWFFRNNQQKTPAVILQK